MAKHVFFFFLTIIWFNNIYGQSIVGQWKTIDDESGHAKSIIEITEKNGVYSGKVVKLLQDAATSVCSRCSGDQKNKPIVGMVVLKDLVTFKDYWSSGKIMDPKNGTTYGCSVWFEKKDYTKLHVRGKHWTGLFRDQIWYKIK